ncbi:MAG: helix-turn-helix domain-containing protein [Rhodospirillales bacterium]|nr:helix-turn-helix domain-containing protein [Rhodospirillales bacterium]
MHGDDNTTSGGEWLSTATFAATAGITERAARKALARAFEGRPWRGKVLIVRKVPSRGGAAGWAFEVLAKSVHGDAEGGPPAAPAASPTTAVPAAAVPALPTRAAPQLSPTCAGASQRYEIIRPVLQHPPGSAGRGSAVREAARRAGVREQRIRAWIAAYKAGGFAALKRRPREDRGRRRHTISAAWDNWADEARLDDAARARIATELERHVRSLWAATTELGARRIALLASDRLAALTEAAGFEGDARRLKTTCKLSLRFVRRNSRYRASAIERQDAKQWHDRHRPRIRRTREGCLPMDVVFGDVHHQDVLLPRADGSTFTAKLVAFLDWPTNRVFVHPVFPAKGEGVRQEHIIEAFIAMTQDPGWGMPRVLYLDNGKEYGCLDRMADALQLVSQMRALDDSPEFDPTLLRRFRPIVKAMPYNAAAKPIEPVFRVLERGFFSNLPGWIGGDRMAKKTANVGREPIPYPHGREAFLADLQGCMTAYHATPQTGVLGGRTPNEAFNEAVDAGWQRMDIARGALLAAFGKDEFRTLHQGGFRYGSRWYTHPALQELGADRRLRLRIPPFGDLPEIPVMDENGRELLCMAATDRCYDVLDPEGAREAGRRLARARAGVARLRADTDRLDVLGAEARRAAREVPAAIPESAGVIRLSEGMEAIGRALERTPSERPAADDEGEEISRDRARALRARFLRKVRATG